jgi:hypothetical protein
MDAWMIRYSYPPPIIQGIFCDIEPTHEQQVSIGLMLQDRVKRFNQLGDSFVPGQPAYKAHNWRILGDLQVLSQIARSREKSLYIDPVAAAVAKDVHFSRRRDPER